MWTVPGNTDLQKRGNIKNLQSNFLHFKKFFKRISTFTSKLGCLAGTFILLCFPINNSALIFNWESQFLVAVFTHHCHCNHQYFPLFALVSPAFPAVSASWHSLSPSLFTLKALEWTTVYFYYLTGIHFLSLAFLLILLHFEVVQKIYSTVLKSKAHAMTWC